MRFSFTIFLTFLALLLSGLAVFFMGSDYRHSVFGSQPVTQGQKLFDASELTQVRQITLTNGDGDEASFKFDQNEWLAITPWQDRADPNYINFLVQFTARLEVQEAISRKKLELDDFGLGEDHIRVTMRDQNGKNICDYRVGRQTAWHVPSTDGKTTQATIFIRLAGEKLKDYIYVCSDVMADRVHELFDNKFARFRDHHPFYFDPGSLDTVRIQNADGEVVISRKTPQSGWSITKPLELSVDPAALTTLFEDIAKLTATKIEDRASVTLPTGEDDTTQSREIAIRFAGTSEETILRISPPVEEIENTVLATVSDRAETVFHLPRTATAALPNSSSLSQLQMGVNDLRSKTMTHLNGPQLKTIILRPEGRSPVMLQRSKKTTWRVLRPKGWEPANQEAVIKLMTAVTRDQVEKFVTDAATDLAPYGLDQPFLRIAFISFSNESMKIAFGRDEENKNIFAHIIGRPNIWQISPETLGKIAQDSWQWRTTHVWHLPRVDVIGIKVSQQGHPPFELDYNHFAGSWTAKQNNKDVTASLNPYRSDKFLGHIESLQTKRWLGPMHPQAMKALENPDITISVALRRINDQGEDLPPMLKTLRIKHTPGGFIHFAKVDTLPQGPDTEDENSYFLIDPETVKQLSINLFE